MNSHEIIWLCSNCIVFVQEY